MAVRFTKYGLESVPDLPFKVKKKGGGEEQKKPEPAPKIEAEKAPKKKTDLKTREKRVQAKLLQGKSEKAARAEVGAEMRAESGRETTVAQEQFEKAIMENPEEFGLERPGAISQPQLEELQRQGLLGEVGKAGLAQLEKTQLAPGWVAQLTGVPQYVDVPIEAKIAGAAAAFGAVGWSAAGTAGTISNPIRAVQLGNAAKNAAKSKSVLSKLKDASLGIIATLYAGEKAVNILNTKVNDQQQALNTLGQITSSIVGDSTTSAGDWRKGLEELRNIRAELLRAEQAIKAGTIKQFPLKIRGQIIDINADIYDQLATIAEGERDIRDFVLTQSFPELTDLEIQNYLRELERGGFIKPVDLTEARREIT